MVEVPGDSSKFPEGEPQLGGPKDDPEFRAWLHDVLHWEEKLQKDKDRVLATLTIDGTTKVADLPQLTPVQLQNQLVLLHSMMPRQIIFPTSWSDQDELVIKQDELGKERVNSDEFTKSAAWFESLLNNSPTTCGFDFYLMREFWKAYRVGINDQEPYDAVSTIIQSSGSAQGGFFNPDLARNYDNEYYRKLLTGKLKADRWAEGIASSPENQRGALRTMADLFVAEGLVEPSDVEGVEDVDLEELKTSEEAYQKLKLEALGWTHEQALEYEFNKYREFCEAMEKPVLLTPRKLLKNITALDVMDALEQRKRYGRPWIDADEYMLYSKGQRLGNQWRKLPIQRVSDDDFLLRRWREDFVNKYGDEP